MQQLQAFKNAQLRTPEFTNNLSEACEWTRQGLLVLGRNLNHTQGRDIVSAFSSRWPTKDYWVKLIPNIREEWRFHIVDGRSIQRQRKHQESSTATPIRNRRSGWFMERSDTNVSYIRELRNAAKAAVAALNYDFGAVDIAVDDNNQPWILEVNQAPGLDEYSANKYADAFIRMYNDGPRTSTTA